MLSIVIPALNEVSVLEATLRQITLQTPSAQIIVVDGGSEDGTPALANSLGASVIASPKSQRATQMNMGGSHATGDHLLFLHADTSLPEGAIDAVEQSLVRTGVVGGAFARRFDSRSIVLKVTCALAYLRNLTLGWHLGDQGIFVRTEIFQSIGGFPNYDRFEDLEFSRRLARVGKVVTLRPEVVSSARRFEKLGPLRTTLRDFALTMRYLKGDPAATFLVGRPQPAT